MNEADLELIQRLVDRLERLSADSTYAHRASGLRGSLYRLLDCMETGAEIDQEDLHQLLEQGFMILQNAAKEVGVSR